MAKKEKSDELIVVDAERYRRVKKALEESQGKKKAPTGPEEKEATRELVVVDVKRYKKVKKALAESEERYRHLFENVPIGIYRTTPDGRIVDANPALIAMLGYASFAELAKRNLEQSGFEPGYDRRSFIRLLEREGEIKGLEAGWKKRDGTLIQVRENAKLVCDDLGQVFFEGTVEDVTQGKLAEEALRRHTRQIEILNVIISRGNLAGALPELLDVILDCVSELLEFDTVAVFLLDPEAREMKQLAVRGAEPGAHLSDKYLVLENPPFANVLRGEAVYVDQVAQAIPEMAAEWGWGMAGSIPLVSKGRVIGALNAASRHRDAFSSEEKNILEMIGKEAGTLISKLQTEAALRESEKYYRTLVETSPDFVFTLALDGTMTMVNRRFLQFSGFAAGDIVGHNVLEFVGDMDPGFLQEGMRSLAQSNEIFFFEYPVRRKDGSAFPLEMALSVLTDAGGRPAGIMGVGRDISERKRAEAVERARTQQIEILNTIITRGNLAESLPEMLDKTLESMVESLGFDTAGIYMYDPGAKKVKLMARRGRPSQFYQLDEYMAIDSMPFSQVLLHGQPVYADQLRDTLPDLAEKWGWRMAGVIPLVSKGRIIGALGLASCRREVFTPEEKNILELVGREAGTLVSKLQTEAALRQSEKYYRTLIDTSPDIIAVMDLEARLITVNQQFLKTGGYFYDEVIGACSYDFVAGLDRDLLARRTEQFIARRKASGSEYVFRKKDGRTIPLDVSAGFLFDDDGNPSGIIAIGRDISERKQSENALRESEEIFRRTFAAIPNPAYMWVEQGDGRVTLSQFNHAAEAITQGKIQGFLGIDVDCLYANQPELAHKIKATMRDGEPLSEEIQYVFQSTGETKWLVVDYVRTSPGHVMVITRDVSERKQAEAKLLAYQEQLRALTSELTLVEERERRRLAADLHDQIGQNLALCKLKVVALEKGRLTVQAKSELSAVRRLLECSIQDARSLIFDLSPPVLYELGFEAALEWLAEWIGAQYHVPVDFESHAEGVALETDSQVILFQVVRELLVNMGKHAQAGRAKVILSREGGSLRIRVNDDGRGFDVSPVFDSRKPQGGYGFFSMRERLNYLGGSITVRSKPGMGTQVTLTVPKESPAAKDGGKEGS